MASDFRIAPSVASWRCSLGPNACHGLVTYHQPKLRHSDKALEPSTHLFSSSRIEWRLCRQECYREGKCLSTPMPVKEQNEGRTCEVIRKRTEENSNPTWTGRPGRISTSGSSSLPKGYSYRCPSTLMAVIFPWLSKFLPCMISITVSQGHI